MNYLADAREALDGIKALLLTPAPRNLAECGEPLRRTAEALRQLGAMDQPNETAAALKQDLSDIRTLLEQAGEFYFGWISIVNSMTGSYDAGGDLHPPGGATLSVEG